jgi:hypothetical protein
VEQSHQGGQGTQGAVAPKKKKKKKKKKKRDVILPPYMLTVSVIAAVTPGPTPKKRSVY